MEKLHATETTLGKSKSFFKQLKFVKFQKLIAMDTQKVSRLCYFVIFFRGGNMSVFGGRYVVARHMACRRVTYGML